jgi:hypothetical protein
MELDVQKIAANIASQLENLDSEKISLRDNFQRDLSELQRKEKLLKELAGITPVKVSKKRTGKNELLRIATEVLKIATGSRLTPADICKRAIDEKIWLDAPKTAVASMRRLLNKLPEDCPIEEQYGLFFISSDPEEEEEEEEEEESKRVVELSFLDRAILALKENRGSFYSSSEIVDLASANGEWTPPRMAKAQMARVLKNLPEYCEIAEDNGRYFIPEYDESDGLD